VGTPRLREPLETIDHRVENVVDAAFLELVDHFERMGWALTDTIVGRRTVPRAPSLAIALIAVIMLGLLALDGPECHRPIGKAEREVRKCTKACSS
jgi:hypothetical protein